jgi:hypothetical protein
MSAVTIPLPASATPAQLLDAVGQLEHDDLRVVLTRDGEPMAAVVSIEDLHAIEELDAAEDAYWRRLTDEAHARWEAEGRPPGISHEDLLTEPGLSLEPE